MNLLHTLNNRHTRIVAVVLIIKKDVKTWENPILSDRNNLLLINQGIKFVCQ